MTKLKPDCPHDWHQYGDVIMTFTRGGEVSDALWDEFVAYIEQAQARVLLAVTSIDMATMSATQRKKGAEALKNKNLTAIVITDSRIARGILTAVSWLGADVKPIPWSSLDTALDLATKDPTVRGQLQSIAREFYSQTEQRGS